MKGLSKTQKTKIKNEVAETVISEIQNQTQAQKSPVTGDKFKKLSKAYKDFKKSEGKGTKADLFHDGLMLGDLHTKNKENGVEFKITDTLSKYKSMSHNKGEKLGGAKGVPRRPFLPDDTKKTGKYKNFNSKITEKINKIIRKHKSANKS